MVPATAKRETNLRKKETTAETIIKAIPTRRTHPDFTPPADSNHRLGAAVRPPERRPRQGPMASENLGPTHPVVSASRLDRDTSNAAAAATNTAPGPSWGPGFGYSASLHGHGRSHSQGQTSASASSPAHDSSVDPTIRALLDQQAEIEAKIAALLPRKHGPDFKVELAMLRHKLKSLRAFADDNRKQALCIPLSLNPALALNLLSTIVALYDVLSASTGSKRYPLCCPSV